MDEISRYVTGIDVGTENVRAVIAAVNGDGSLSVVGYGEGKTTGMRKGVPANLTGPAESIDKMIETAERMCGQTVSSAFLSINGEHINSFKTDGMVIVGAADHEINDEDLNRVEDAAVAGHVPQNYTVLDVIPLQYRIDGQGGIKDAYGMAGARLELEAAVVSALTPNCENLKKVAEGANIEVAGLVPSAVAAGKAVLTDKQRENGVAVIDFGATTTSVAIFEEGDLQYTGVVPIGSNNVTNDLAIVLEISTDLAEEIKTRFVTGNFGGDKSATIKVGKNERVFERKEVEAVVEARMHEIFEEIRRKIKAAKYDQRLPEGVVLTGGGARMRDVEYFAKTVLETAVVLGVPRGLNGVSEDVQKPEFATAVGLMMLAAENGQKPAETKKKAGKKAPKPKGENFLKKIFGKF